VSYLCEVYSGFFLTTEEKAWKNLSQGSWRMPQIIHVWVSVRSLLHADLRASSGSPMWDTVGLLDEQQQYSNSNNIYSQ
jgi:hypothetical protein